MEWMLLPYKRYFDFKGRSRRMEYWMFALFVFLVYLVLGGLMLAGMPNMAAMMNPDAGAMASPPGPLFFVGAGLLGLFGLGSIIPMIAVVVRRLHDRDMSGWWYLGAILAALIPFVGFIASIALLVVMCLPGTPGPNRFGPDPLDPTNANVFA